MLAAREDAAAAAAHDDDDDDRDTRVVSLCSMRIRVCVCGQVCHFGSDPGALTRGAADRTLLTARPMT